MSFWKRGWGESVVGYFLLGSHIKHKMWSPDFFFSLTKQIQAFESLPNMWDINSLNVELKILLSTGHRQVLGWPLQSPCEDHWSEVNTDYRTSSYGGYYVVCIAFFGMVSSFLHGNACWVVWFVVFFFFDVLFYILNCPIFSKINAPKYSDEVNFLSSPEMPQINCMVKKGKLQISP